MVVYIDENFPLQLAEGLDILIKPAFPTFDVKTIKSTFGAGAKDPQWIPPAGRQGAALITQDLNIHRTRSLRNLYIENGLGVFFFKPPSKTGYTYWQMVNQIIGRWARIVDICNTKPLPFAYVVRTRKADFERM